MAKPTRRVRVLEVNGATTVRREDRLATEEPLEIRVDAPGRSTERFGITMRTPGNDFELAAGLLYSESVYVKRDDVRSIAYCTDADLTADEEFNVVTVHLDVATDAIWRPRVVSSACGVCGKQSAADVAVAADTVLPDVPIRTDVVTALPERLLDAQRVFATTGGLHAAGIFDVDGSPLVVREDVGRHNAVDKVLGHCLLNEIDTSTAILCVSGRVAFEIVQKAAMTGIPVIAAVGAPTSLAVDTAREVGSTVIGFVREGRLVVYSHPERVRND